MAIVIWVKREFPDGKTYTIPTLYPTGRVISREEREQAERLDRFLAKEMPKVARALRGVGAANSGDIIKWHGLGRRLQFADDEDLVKPSDRNSGLIWLAVRQYLPPEFLARGEESLTPERIGQQASQVMGQRRLAKKHDHLERCYKLGRHDLSEVSWMTWSDFDTFLESPGLERDERILPLLASLVRTLGRRLSRSEFRAIAKTLREQIPTKHRERDTSQLPLDDLREMVSDAFARVLKDEVKPKPEL